MKKLGLIITSVSIAFMTGCVQPPFNPNNKQIIMVEGEAFRVPNMSSNIGYRYTNSEADKERREAYRQQGLICKKGDVLWMEDPTAKQALSIMKEKGKLAAYAYVGKVSKEGKTGCVSPLSNREYEFYRSKEIEAKADDIRARESLGNAFINAGNSFNNTTYVNHTVTGTMNHNVNVTTNPYQRY